MASEVYVGRVRSLVPASALSLATLGLYFLVWFYQLNHEIRRHRGRGVEPMGLFALFLLIPVIGWFLAFMISGHQVRRVQESADADARTSPWYPALWGLLPIVGWVTAAGILQAGANRAWARLHEDLGHATSEPVRLQCPDCAGQFAAFLTLPGPTHVACPQCGRAGDV